MEANDRFKLFHVCVCTLVVGSSRVGFLHATERMFRKVFASTFPATRRTDLSHGDRRSLFFVCQNCKNISPRFRGQLLHRDTPCFQVRRATEAVQRLCQCPSERCSKLKVRKVGEGRYHIAGRNVFIRVRNTIFVRLNR